MFEGTLDLSVIKSVVTIAIEPREDELEDFLSANASAFVFIDLCEDLYDTSLNSRVPFVFQINEVFLDHCNEFIFR